MKTSIKSNDPYGFFLSGLRHDWILTNAATRSKFPEMFFFFFFKYIYYMYIYTHVQANVLMEISNTIILIRRIYCERNS